MPMSFKHIRIRCVNGKARFSFIVFVSRLVDESNLGSGEYSKAHLIYTSQARNTEGEFFFGLFLTLHKKQWECHGFAPPPLLLEHVHVVNETEKIKHFYLIEVTMKTNPPLRIKIFFHDIENSPFFNSMSRCFG